VYGTYFLIDSTNTPYPSAVKREMLKVRMLLSKVGKNNVEHAEGELAFVPIDNSPLPTRTRHDKRYEIEKILGHMPAAEGAGYKYKVRWAGYGPGDDTWADAEDLNAPILLRAYWESVAAKEGEPRRSNRKNRN
jgi:hypothetical protein